MTQLSEEQQERMKQIKARLENVRPEEPLPIQVLLDANYLLSVLDSDSQAAGDEQRGYWPTLLDRGDGVAGHFCIGRLVKPSEPYWEFWNKGQWASAGEVFVGREAAQKQLDAIRVGDDIDPLDNDAVDKELARWQDAIRDKLIDLGAPDWKIDGAGCDSGDPLDFTLAEVGQGCGWFIDKAESAATLMRDKCVEKVSQILNGLMIQLPQVSDSYLRGQGWNSALVRANNEVVPALSSLTLDLLVTNGMTRRKARALARQIARMFATENRKGEA